MNWKSEWKYLLAIAGLFLLFFYLPLGQARFDSAVFEGLYLAKWYAREHVILCLLPAFFIAGAIGAFVSQASVMRYLGPRANKTLAYGVASVSGTVLAVCSCTVLPIFAGIYGMGAGLGPATAFLYSGPAINVLAIILTGRVLGMEIGIARTVGAVVFSIVIGLLMHFIFLKEENAKAEALMKMPDPIVKRPLWQNIIFFISMIAILVFANWAKPEVPQGFWDNIYNIKWYLTGLSAIVLGITLILWFGLSKLKIVIVGAVTILLVILFPHQPVISFGVTIVLFGFIISNSKGDCGEWFSQTWGFTKQITPLLLIGVLVAGFLLGRPGHEGVIPSAWISNSVGGNSLGANFVASIVGAFMYFATLTEIPILQGLIGSGMGNGPALALLLAGPALSLPSMLVLKQIFGLKKTVVYVSLVVVMATITGIIFGAIF